MGLASRYDSSPKKRIFGAIAVTTREAIAFMFYQDYLERLQISLLSPLLVTTKT